ncbi:hypothetical protein SEA_NYCEIRAE_39 [Gordonia phage Nyceirae]|uniref:Lipoprotein n=1 Tax=Gordonia phage Nyceirae TaxID=1887651 RepID=A0A1C9EI20_9CAUD|nr:hypothetical protein BIZ68_gp39 [Gordonia phage Nyceirae]AON97402.1 hypothetical protein SEA_NYCEIRAE_39 [Gordonia phage Nyceirae]
MRISTAIAAATISAGLLVTSCGGGGSDSAGGGADQGFAGSGTISAMVTYPQIGAPDAEACVVSSASGTIQRGTSLIVRTQDGELVGESELPQGSLLKDESGLVGWCEWRFSVEVTQRQPNYQIEVGDGSVSTAGQIELSTGEFKFLVPASGG